MAGSSCWVSVRVGEVWVLGDSHAHTGMLDDRGGDSDGILDDMGGMGGAVHSRLVPIPARANSDAKAPCEVGRRLVEMCVASKCVMLNGRAPGDEEGVSTFVGAQGSSVIDYGIVSRSLFPCVSTFAVEDNFGLSDHNPLVMVVALPKATSPVLPSRKAPLAVRCCGWAGPGIWFEAVYVPRAASGGCLPS
jgi:hypothetical protein